jgi:fermentation-respiration switch protein FrsA (DUF1100 family)
MTNTPQTSASRRLFSLSWRTLRVFLIAYVGACLVMMAREASIIYPAPPASRGNWQVTDPPHEEVAFQSADGTRLFGWFVPNPNSKRVILYCHGNGENVALDADLAALMKDRLNASVFLFDYRGYGRSEGSPGEAGCIADGQAARAWLCERLQIKPSDIVLVGHSLGGGVATALAADGGAQALVLENTFSRLVDVAADTVWWLPVKLIMRNRYDSVARIRRYNGPVFQTHGAEDTLIPFHFGRELFEAAPTANKRFVENAGRGHDDPPPANYFRDLAAFLDEIDLAEVKATPQ